MTPIHQAPVNCTAQSSVLSSRIQRRDGDLILTKDYYPQAHVGVPRQEGCQYFSAVVCMLLQVDMCCWFGEITAQNIYLYMSRAKTPFLSRGTVQPLLGLTGKFASHHRT